MINSDQQAYYELSCYTLNHPDRSFIHQYIVDAYTVQHVNKNTKPTAILFALIGLYLCVEKKYTGKQIQQIHMLLGKKRKQWPKFNPPEQKGNITVHNILAIPAGKERDETIVKWCKSVWDAWKNSQQQIRDYVKNELDI